MKSGHGRKRASEAPLTAAALWQPGQKAYESGSVQVVPLHGDLFMLLVMDQHTPTVRLMLSRAQVEKLSQRLLEALPARRRSRRTPS